LHLLLVLLLLLLLNLLLLLLLSGDCCYARCGTCSIVLWHHVGIGIVGIGRDRRRIATWIARITIWRVLEYRHNYDQLVFSTGRQAWTYERHSAVLLHLKLLLELCSCIRIHEAIVACHTTVVLLLHVRFQIELEEGKARPQKDLSASCRRQ